MTEQYGPLSRNDAIKIINKATDHDDPYWENVIQDWYDEERDTWPSIWDVFNALGISEDEYRKATGQEDSNIDWPCNKGEIAMGDNISVQDQLPTMYKSYHSLNGDPCLVSRVVITNKGEAVLLDGEWVTVCWDSVEAGRPLDGVNCWSPLPEIQS